MPVKWMCSVASPAGMIFAKVSVACCFSASRLTDPVCVWPSRSSISTLSNLISIAFSVMALVGSLMVDVDRFRAGERGGLQVGRELKRIMRGNNIRREALRLGSARRAEKKTKDCDTGAKSSAQERKSYSEISSGSSIRYLNKRSGCATPQGAPHPQNAASPCRP